MEDVRFHRLEYLIDNKSDNNIVWDVNLLRLIFSYALKIITTNFNWTIEIERNQISNEWEKKTESVPAFDPETKILLEVHSLDMRKLLLREYI